jgi:hypothetical protein
MKRGIEPLAFSFNDVSGGFQPPHVVLLKTEIINMKTAKTPMKITKANILRTFIL